MKNIRTVHRDIGLRSFAKLEDAITFQRFYESEEGQKIIVEGLGGR